MNCPNKSEAIRLCLFDLTTNESRYHSAEARRERAELVGAQPRPSAITGESSTALSADLEVHGQLKVGCKSLQMNL